MITACCARVLQRCTGRLYMGFRFILRAVRPIGKTRNQLRFNNYPQPAGTRLGQSISKNNDIPYATIRSGPCWRCGGAWPSLRQAHLPSRLGKLPFALLQTTTVIPFPVLVHGGKRRTVLQGLEAPRTLRLLEIVGQPHTTSPWSFAFTPRRAHRPSWLLRRWSGAATQSGVPRPVRQPAGRSIRRVQSTA